MGNCLAPPADVKQRRGAAAARLKAWRATGIVTLPPGSKEVPAAVFEELAAAVKVLDCGGAALQQLPPEVGRLVNLTRLAAVRRPGVWLSTGFPFGFWTFQNGFY
jgi:hypothetical protein